VSDALALAQLIEDIPHILVVAATHAEPGANWQWWEVVTLMFSGGACVQVAIRWLLWLGRRQDHATEPDDATANAQTDGELQTALERQTALAAAAEKQVVQSRREIELLRAQIAELQASTHSLPGASRPASPDRLSSPLLGGTAALSHAAS
jgi:hypothetical protein